MNRLIVIGNLGRDPEMRYTPGGQARALSALSGFVSQQNNRSTGFTGPTKSIIRLDQAMGNRSFPVSTFQVQESH